MFIIKFNIYNGLLNENFEVKQSDKDIIMSDIRNNKIKINWMMRIKLANFLKRLSNFKYSDLIESHSIIKDHCIDKGDLMNKDDLDAVIFALKDLGINENICTKINDYLRGNILLREQRIKSDNEKQIRRKERKQKEEERRKHLPVIEPKTLITASVIRRTLNSYFDFDNNIARSILTLDEIIYCVVLLRNLNKDKRQIDSFIRIQTEYNFEHADDPISQYRVIRKKLLFYKSKGIGELEDIIADIDKIEQGYPNLKSDDARFYNDYTRSLLKDAINLLKNKGEYERMMADKVPNNKVLVLKS